MFSLSPARPNSLLFSVVVYKSLNSGYYYFQLLHIFIFPRIFHVKWWVCFAYKCSTHPLERTRQLQWIAATAEYSFIFICSRAGCSFRYGVGGCLCSCVCLEQREIRNYTMIRQMLLFFSFGRTHRLHHISSSHSRYISTLPTNAVITFACVRGSCAVSEWFVLATANCDTINCKRIETIFHYCMALIRFVASTKLNSDSFKFNVSHTLQPSHEPNENWIAINMRQWIYQTLAARYLLHMPNAQSTLKNAIRAGKSCLVTNETILLRLYAIFYSDGIGVCCHTTWIIRDHCTTTNTILSQLHNGLESTKSGYWDEYIAIVNFEFEGNFSNKIFRFHFIDVEKIMEHC